MDDLDIIGANESGSSPDGGIQRLRFALENLKDLRFEVAAAERVDWRAGYRIQTHCHDELFHLEYFSGNGDFFLEGKSFPLRKQTLLMIPPGFTHAFGSKPSGRMDNQTVKFHVEGARAIRACPVIYHRQPDRALARRVHSGLAWVFEEHQIHPDGWKPVCDGILRSLTASMLREGIRMLTPPPHGVLAQACHIMALEYSQPLQLREVASRCGVRADSLSRLFRTHLGVSPRDYLQSIRLKQAQMLLTSGYTVTEVAAHTGFSSVHYFSRVFCSTFGTPPSLWRRST